MNTKDRFRGAMFGLAAGDALGTTVEFRQRGTFKPLTTIVGGGVFGLNPGDWTDDTSMALCIAESLGKKKEFDPAHQMDLYVQWWAHGHNSSRPDKGAFDMGGTVRGSLRLWKTRKATYPDSELLDPYCGPMEPETAGNGGIMRLAPIPLFFYKEKLSIVARYSYLSSRTTHGAINCAYSAKYLGVMVALAVQGKSKEEIFDLAADHMLNNYDTPAEVLNIIDGSYKEESDRFISGRGYVITTLEAALWAFYHTDNFADGACKVVNLGDDADTTGAVYGQLAGAFYGFDGIPKAWTDMLTRKDLINKYTNKLYEVVHSNGSN